MKASKSSPTKRPAPATARKLHEPVRKRKAVLTMPIPRAPRADNLAERIEAHRKEMGSLAAAYRECMQEIFRDPRSLAKKQALIKQSVRQFAAALVDWQLAALELVSETQALALLQMLPDAKGGRWLN